MFSDIVHFVRDVYDVVGYMGNTTLPKHKKKREENEYVERIKTLPK